MKSTGTLIKYKTKYIYCFNKSLLTVVMPFMEYSKKQTVLCYVRNLEINRLIGGKIKKLVSCIEEILKQSKFTVFNIYA